MARRTLLFVVASRTLDMKITNKVRLRLGFKESDPKGDNIAFWIYF